MITFKQLEDIRVIEPYLDQAETAFCDYTKGALLMWYNSVRYCVVEDTLILRRSFEKFRDFFSYPMGKNPEGALKELENYCLFHHIPLCMAPVGEEIARKLQNRYPAVHVRYSRDWSDYIYRAQELCEFAGKKYAKQRSNIHLFEKQHTLYHTEDITEENLPAYIAFLRSIAEEKKDDPDKRAEIERSIRFLPSLLKAGCVGIGLVAEGTIVAMSVGEIVKDTFVCHIEKAKRDVTGAYQMIVREAARRFTDERICFVNREDDAGDEGLRTSKLRYRPIEIRGKYIITVGTLFDRIKAPVRIEGEKVVVDELQDGDGERYFALASDIELNQYWGYDYRRDLGDQKATPDYFFSFVRRLKESKEEYALAVRVGGELIGECVLYQFDCFGGVSLGFRILSPYQSQGFGSDAIRTLARYAKNILGAKTVRSECFPQNDASHRALLRAGFHETGRDKRRIYFEF